MRFQRGSIEVHSMNMNQFAARLGLRMDRDVFDATGLDGAFDFRLEFVSDMATPGFGGENSAISIAGVGTAAPSIFDALVEQVGLRLQPAKSASQVLVIDQVERPSED
jgi:uncharacterized protein (TIGR03435 family)